MKIQTYLEHLGLEVKQAGSQLQINCPNCNDTKKHLYIAPGNGLGFCHKCSWSPNPYKLAEKVTSKVPAEIMALLEEFGLNDDSTRSVSVETTTRQGKEIALSKDEIRALTDAEKQTFCEIKQINLEAFEKLKPYAHKVEPWVLLPAFNPAESNKAAGWLRCRLDGKPIELADGRKVKYPIVAGSRHGLFALPWLQSKKPETIVFTEGWRDALAAISIGLHATASSGGASCFNDDWLSFFEGKTVYICMDTDLAGQRAAQRAAERIYTVAKAVFIVSLPYEVTEDHGRDLHDYISEHGKDFLLLLSKAKKYVADSKEAVECGDEGVVKLDNDHPDIIATAFVADCDVVYRYNSIDGWSMFSSGRYEHVDDEQEVGVYIRRFLRRCYYKKQTKNDSKIVRVRPSNSRVKDILGAMAALEGVHIRPEQHALASLTGKYNPKDIIAMNNCLLDISGDEPKEQPLSEEFYTFNYLPFDYDSEADCNQWLKFLSEIFTKKTESAEWDGEKEDFIGKYDSSADESAIFILQEWMGYFITSETHLQKIFGLIGPRRSGKSTIGKVIRALVGPKNTASPTLTSLATEFGLQPLLNKTIGIIGDANISGKASDILRAVERLKSISESRADFEAVSSPMTAFVNEWCQVGPDKWVPVDALWKAQSDWCKRNGRGDGFSKQKFALKIKSVVPGIVKERRRLELSTLEDEYTMDRSSGDNRVNVYVGIDLKDEYKTRVDSMDTQDRGWTP